MTILDAECLIAQKSVWIPRPHIRFGQYPSYSRQLKTKVIGYVAENDKVIALTFKFFNHKNELTNHVRTLETKLFNL